MASRPIALRLKLRCHECVGKRAKDMEVGVVVDSDSGCCVVHESVMPEVGGRCKGKIEVPVLRGQVHVLSVEFIPDLVVR